MTADEITTYATAAAVALTTISVALVKLGSAWKEISTALGLKDAGNLHTLVTEIKATLIGMTDQATKQGAQIASLDTRVTTLETSCPVVRAVEPPETPAPALLDS